MSAVEKKVSKREVAAGFRALLKSWLKNVRTLFSLSNKVYEYDTVMIDGAVVTKDMVREMLTVLLNYAKYKLNDAYVAALSRSSRRKGTQTGASLRKPGIYTERIVNFFINAGLRVGDADISAFLRNTPFFANDRIANNDVFRPLFAIYAVQNNLFNQTVTVKKGKTQTTRRNMSRIRLDDALYNTFGTPTTKKGVTMDRNNIQLYMYATVVASQNKTDAKIPEAALPEFTAAVGNFSGELRKAAEVAVDAYKASM